MEAEEPRRARAEDLKPGDRFTSDRAEGEFVVESVAGSSAFRIIRTSVGKVFGLPQGYLVRIYSERTPDNDQ